MSWFFIALIGPFFYALTNHIDKILLEKYFKESGVGTLILFSSLLSIIAVPFLFWADPSVLSVGMTSMLVLIAVGVLNLMVLWCYFMALKDEEASIAIVFYQLVPVIGAILGYYILGEALTQLQIIAMAIVILGTTIISFEIDAENNFKLRRRTIILMTAASTFWALESVIFKAVALEENLWRSLFWEHVVLIVAGVLIFIFIRSYRLNFIAAIKNNSRAILSLNVVNESLYMLGNLALAYAYLLAPIALVLLTDSFQPIFVIAIGIFLTIFFPKLTAEKITAKHLFQKLIAIVITGIGAYLLLIA